MICTFMSCVRDFTPPAVPLIYVAAVVQLMFNLTTPDLSVICTKHVSRSYYSYTYVVGSYTEDLENSQTVKIKGWDLRKDGHLPGTIRH